MISVNYEGWNCIYTQAVRWFNTDCSFRWKFEVVKLEVNVGNNELRRD
jgi:hypothetical protein